MLDEKHIKEFLKHTKRDCNLCAKMMKEWKEKEGEGMQIAVVENHVDNIRYYCKVIMKEVRRARGK